MSDPVATHKIKPYKRHIILCVGDTCYEGDDSLALYDYLKERLRSLALDQGELRVLRSKSTCLGICAQGPVAVVYPEGVWYKCLTRKKLDRILEEHLIKGNPVREYQFQTSSIDGAQS